MPCSLQRVYDDDDDDEDIVDIDIEEFKKTDVVEEDPMSLLKKAFSAGQEAFKLYYGDDTLDGKEEVGWS